VLEAAELRKPGRLQFQLAVKLFAGGGRHTLEVAAVNPKGLPEPGGSVAHSFDVSNPAWGERFAVPISFPCEYVGWWTLRLTLDGAPLGETHLWVQFVPY
jgi:hypothetical protein